MNRIQRLPPNLAALLTFSRPLLVFSSFACALWVMATNFPPAYMLGATFLLLATTFDWIDGWFAERASVYRTARVLMEGRVFALAGAQEAAG